MADVIWRGLQRARAQVATLTIGTASTGGTITVTVGGTKSVIITPTTTNTTTTATELLAALQACTEGEFTEITWTSSGAVVTGTGPADGAPFTIAKTDGGSNATTLASSATAPLSPHDAADGANYSTGAIPAAADRLVFQDGDVSVKYGLTGLTNAISVLRRDTYTGAIGLPDQSANGYVEYRRTHLDVDATAIVIEQSAGDFAGQFRLECTSAAACTLTVTGGSPAQLGAEVVDIYGLPASSVLNVAGGSVLVAGKVGQTATVATWLGTRASFRFGSGVTLTAGERLRDVTALVLCSWSGSLTLDGGDVTVGGSAAGSLVIDGGRVVWRSTGNPGNSPAIGSGGSLDLTQAPKTLTIGGTVAAYAGGALDDTAGRGGNYALQWVRCTPQEFDWRLPPNKTATLS
jgi:hypothetical protein